MIAINICMRAQIFALLIFSFNNTFSQTISTGTIYGSPFVFTNKADVPFTTTGSFKSGNVFSAELSDSSGSFVSGTTIIGTLADTVSGTIVATLPSSGIASTLY